MHVRVKEAVSFLTSPGTCRPSVKERTKRKIKEDAEPEALEVNCSQNSKIRIKSEVSTQNNNVFKNSQKQKNSHSNASFN